MRVEPLKHVLIKARAGAFLCILLTALSGTSCRFDQGGAQAPTHVQRGELYETGSAIYDEYFKTVHELDERVAWARLEERDGRLSLATNLQLLPTAEPEQLLRKLREATQQMPKMQMRVSGNGQARRVELKVVDQAASAGPAAELGKAIETTANTELDISRRMAVVPEHAHRMRKVGETLLESAAGDFANTRRAKRDQIATELKASLEVLDRIADDARSVSARTRVFVEDMSAALDATKEAAPAAEPPPKAAAKPKPPPRQTPAAAAPAQAKPPPAKPPAAAPPSDFNP